MHKQLNTKNYIISKNNDIFFIKNISGWTDNLYNKKKHIKASYFIWNYFNHRYQFSLSKDDYPCLYLTYKQDTNWKLFCEEDSYSLGLCSINPLKQLSLELRTFKQLCGNTINILPIHINITIYNNTGKYTHANTLLITKNDAYLFEPLGSINRKFNYLQSKINHNLRYLCNENRLNFKGFFLPDCDFQIYDDDLCYLWTSWLEIHILLNPKNSIDRMRRYFRNEYKNYLKQYSNKKMIIFDNYLNQIIN